MKTIAIAGNCLASMVAAYEAAKNGHDVVLINGLSGWGGHFAAREIWGKKFDLGTVCFEFTSFASEQLSDVSAYRTRSRYGIAPYCRAAHDFVESVIPVEQSSSPLMVHNGEVVPDLIMGNDLSALRALPRDVAGRIQAETQAIVARDNPLHPSRKIDNPLHLSSTYEQASLANHGETFHQTFIAPFANKMLPGGAADLAAIYHRCLWLPIYYPETILAAFGDAPHKLRPTLFHYPRAGHISALIETLLAHLVACERVRIVSANVTNVDADFRISLSNEQTVKADRLVWGLDLPTLMRTSGMAEQAALLRKERKAAAAFVFLLIDRKKFQKDFSCLFVVDGSRVTYRIANLSTAANLEEDPIRLSLECDAGYADGPEGKRDAAAFVQKATLELVDLGIVSDTSAILQGDALIAASVLPVPNALDHKQHWDTHDCIERALPRVELVGPASGYFTKSLNDQIIQGLQVGRRA